MSATQAQPAAMLVPARRPTLRFAEIARLAARLAPAPVGLACWANSMAALRLDSVGLYGLLASVNAWFFIGVALLIVGFAAELSRAHRHLWILVLYVLAIVIVIDATVPLLFHTPEYWWVYKHIGVAQSLQLHGRVTLPNEIYQEWPTFFSALAAISSLSGASPLRFATWASLFFELSYCVVLLAIFKSMTRDSRVPILAVLLFECVVSWVGEDYLSPQAFAYLLWLGMMLVVLRWLTGWAPHQVSSRRLARLRGLLLRGFEYRPAPSRSTSFAAVAAVMTLFFVIVSSHQLTPYTALAGFVGMAALGLLRPWWLLPALIAIAAAFLLPRYHIVSSQYGGLFSGFNIFGNAGGRAQVSEPAPALFSQHIATGLSVAMWLFTLAIIARSLAIARAGGRPRRAGVCALRRSPGPELRRRGDLQGLPVLGAMVCIPDRYRDSQGSAAAPALCRHGRCAGGRPHGFAAGAVGPCQRQCGYASRGEREQLALRSRADRIHSHPRRAELPGGTDRRVREL